MHSRDAENDTIAAIATAPGEAGIAIVRVSGPRSLAIADRVFSCSGPPPSQRPGYSFLYGTVRGTSTGGASVTDIDKAILLIFRSPHSYTREDVVEIQGHGGARVAQRVLRAVVEAGARLAEPGEFTRRAFLNGRIDLLQAEAVLDLIRARSDRAADAAFEQLQGRLTREISKTYDDILCALSNLEVTLDFPEEEIPLELVRQARERLSEVGTDLQKLLASREEGRLLREGALVVISGRPNVGKSTLLNGLLGTDRAIVTEIPGTTRDTIEESLLIGGIPIRLVDTAGLRESSCRIEQEGIARADNYRSRADLNLYLVDTSCPLDVEDSSRLGALDKRHTIVLLNKVDLGRRIDPGELSGFTVLETCLLREADVDAVRSAIRAKIESIIGIPSVATVSERHRSILLGVQDSVDRAIRLLDERDGETVVLAAGLLHRACEGLGSLTGRVFTVDLLDTVFSRFCIGK